VEGDPRVQIAEAAGLDRVVRGLEDDREIGAGELRAGGEDVGERDGSRSDAALRSSVSIAWLRLLRLVFEFIGEFWLPSALFRCLPVVKG
jgi:hypothetical protein